LNPYEEVDVLCPLPLEFLVTAEQVTRVARQQRAAPTSSIFIAFTFGFSYGFLLSAIFPP
jgi:hypothetical protein